MNYFYGCIDIKSRAWGFVEETDSRVTENMIKLSRDEWRNLLNAQSSGKQIVCFENKVFATDEIGKYYLDDNNVWKMKADDVYSAEKLEQAKKAKIAENEQKRKVEYINTPLGKLKTETPLGDLKTALPLYDKIAMANSGLPANSVRLYNDGKISGNPALSLDDYNKISLKVALEYIKIDTYSTQLTASILSAKSIDELGLIEIDYNNLPELQFIALK